VHSLVSVNAAWLRNHDVSVGHIASIFMAEEQDKQKTQQKQQASSLTCVPNSF
jgi:hypothetical protein